MLHMLHTSRQSADTLLSLEFHIPPGMLCTSIKISVVYKGVFTARGYILGRLAVGLYRVPENTTTNDDDNNNNSSDDDKVAALPPISVGYAPASECELVRTWPRDTVTP